MSRAAAQLAERTRIYEARERESVPERRARQQARRIRFIESERLAGIEATFVARDFDPGPEYDEQ